MFTKIHNTLNIALLALGLLLAVATSPAASPAAHAAGLTPNASTHTYSITDAPKNNIGSAINKLTNSLVIPAILPLGTLFLVVGAVMWLLGRHDGLGKIAVVIGAIALIAVAPMIVYKIWDIVTAAAGTWGT